MHTKYCLKLNGCNLLLIDFLLPPSRRPVCQMQSPAMHRRQQTVPLPRIRRYQFAGRAGWICFHTGLQSNRLLCSLIKPNMFPSFSTLRHLSLWTLILLGGLFVYSGPPCIRFMLFHQNPHNGFPKHTCSPLALCVLIMFCLIHVFGFLHRYEAMHENVLSNGDAQQRNCEHTCWRPYFIHSDFDSN